MSMTWAMALIVFGGTAAIVLLVPVRVDLDVDLGEGTMHRPVRARVRWLLLSWKSGKPAEPEHAAPQPTRRRLRERRRKLSVVAALGTPGFLQRLTRGLAGLLRALRLREAHVQVRVGLDDPAATGTLVGAAHALAALTSVRDWTLRVEPDFTGPSLGGHAALRWSVRPGAVLWPIGRFVASPVTWRAFRAARRSA